jgi:hypothetical protein
MKIPMVLTSHDQLGNTGRKTSAARDLLSVLTADKAV